MYVLIVDDNEDMRDILAMNLTSLGVAYRLAENGQVAWEMIEEERPAAVLLDLMMPVMDGFSLMAKLNRSRAYKGMPIIVLSAVASGVAAQRLQGAFAIMQKGRIRASDLKDTLTQAGVFKPAIP